jgi:hypothetical protein
VLYDTSTQHLGRWLDDAFFFEESQEHWCARFLFAPPLAGVAVNENLDVLIHGTSVGFESTLQAEARAVLVSFPELSARIFSFLCAQTQLNLEGRMVDLHEEAEARDPENWKISWIEFGDQSSRNSFDVVCHLQTDDWVYVCWRVTVRSGEPTSLVGETW